MSKLDQEERELEEAFDAWELKRRVFHTRLWLRASSTNMWKAACTKTEDFAVNARADEHINEFVQAEPLQTGIKQFLQIRLSPWSYPVSLCHPCP